MINVGLIGFGLAGRAFHAPVIHAVPGLRLAAIVQRSGNEAAQLYPDARILRSVEDLLAISDVRLAVIATPNDTHHRIARQCLAAGRDVVVDKPLTPTLQEALDLVKFAETLSIARRTRRIIWANFVGTIGVDALGIGLAAFGLLNPLIAAFIHVASELTFILNSARLLPQRVSTGRPATDSTVM